MLLQEPVHLVYSPVENVLYFSDDKHIYRYHLVSAMVSLTAGRLSGCPIRTDDLGSPQLATEVELTSIQGLAVSPEGNLYIAESQRVWVRKADGRLYPVAGARNQDKSDLLNHPASTSTKSVIDLGLAKDFVFQNITAIAVSLFGEIFVGDRIHSTVYRIHYDLPQQPDSVDSYRILSPLNDEIDSFNRYGQLVATENAATQMTLHHFDYRVNAISGWLSQIRGDNHNSKLRIHRDTDGNLLRLQTPAGRLYNVTLEPGPSQRISTLTDPINGGQWRFTYSTSGLLTHLKRPQDHEPIRFRYAAHSGRLLNILFPNQLFVDITQLQRIHISSRDDLTYANEFNELFSQHDSLERASSMVNLATVSEIYSTQSNHLELEAQFGDPINQWKVKLNQIYQVRSNRNRPVQLSRHISLPGRTNQPDLKHVDTWTYHLNDQTNPNNLDTNLDDRVRSYSNRLKVRRSVSKQSDLPSPAWLSQRLTVSMPNSTLVESSKQNSRLARQAFLRYLGRAYTLAAYSNPEHDVDWQYQKTLRVNNEDLLFVKFNWARQLETYQSASTGQILLQIVYNGNFQPMIFNASLPISESTPTNDRIIFGQENQLSGPTSVAPSPLSITYTNTGYLSAFRWGGANYRFTYDSMNRLKAADLGGPLDTVSFEYSNSNIPYQPTMISVSGVGQFTLLYSDTPFGSSDMPNPDPTGPSLPTSKYFGLSGILTPSGLRRDFTHIMGLNVHQLLFHPWPDSPGPWIFEWATDTGDTNPTSSFQMQHSTHANLVRFVWPSKYRRLSLFPTQRLIVYDKLSVRWDSGGLKQPISLTNAPLVHMVDSACGFRLRQQKTYQGSLLSALYVESHLPGVRNAHPSLGGLLAVQSLYNYDSNMNLISIRTRLFANPQTESAHMVLPIDNLVLDEETTYKYDKQTGQMLATREFDFTHRPSCLYITYPMKNLQLLRQWDDQGRLIQTKLYPLTARREPLYNLSLLYRPKALQPLLQREEREGQVPRWITYVHGPGGRLEAMDREEAGTSLRSHSQLIHNAEGRIARLRVATSDPQMPNGRPESGSMSRSEELQFTYDSRGLLSRRGNWHYMFDDDGFLVERRLHNNYLVDKFTYNSKGLIVWAERHVNKQAEPKNLDSIGESLEDYVGLRRTFAVQYVYDSEDRLIVIRDTLIVRDLVQLFYTDPRYPTRITHLFNHGELKTYRLHYDPIQGHLFAMEQYDSSALKTDEHRPSESIRNENFDKYKRTQSRQNSVQKRLFFIATNHEGTPTAAFSDLGKLVWSAEYSATGSRRISLPSHANSFSNQGSIGEMDLPIGYAGSITDIHTGLLFYPPLNRAYDPLGATFTAPDWRGLIPLRMPNIKRDPSVLDTHKWGSTEQEILGIGPFGLFAQLREAIQSPQWWLKQVGFNVDALLTQFNTYDGSFAKDSLSNLLPLLPKELNFPGLIQSGYHDVFQKLSSKVEHLSMIGPSRLTPGGAQGNGLPSFFLNPVTELDDTALALLPAHTMFDYEVGFYINSDGVIEVIPPTHSESSADQTASQLPKILLSGTHLLDWWIHSKSPQTHMLVQLMACTNKDLSDILKQLASVGLKPPIYDRNTGINLTLHPSDNYTELWLVREPIQWRIRYTSLKEATSTAIREALERGQDAAWLHETKLAQQFLSEQTKISPNLHLGSSYRPGRTTTRYSLGFNYPWTLKDLKDLTVDGFLKNYQWFPLIDDQDSHGSLSCRLYDHPSMYQLRPVNRVKQDSQNASTLR